eukprot:scaffold91416_cov57-Attheya_sp.AAC.1
MIATDQDTMVCSCFSRYLCVESMIFLHALRAIGGSEPPPPCTSYQVPVWTSGPGCWKVT